MEVDSGIKCESKISSPHSHSNGQVNNIDIDQTREKDAGTRGTAPRARGVCSV